MKSLRFLKGLSASAALASICCFTPGARAAQLIWTAGSGADILWTTPSNWNPAGPPASADVAFFNDTGIAADNATLTSRVGGNATVQGLVYRHNSGYHNTELAIGNTLTIASAGTGVVFGVGSETSPAAAQTERVTISGGGSIVVNAPTADLVVRQGSAAGTASKAVLDLSGLESLTADVAHLWVGVANPPGYTSANRNTGDLLLPRRANIRAATSTAAAPGIDVGKSTSNNGGGSSLLLGQENELYADMLGFGRVKENGVSMRFNAAFAAEGNATAKFRAADRVSRVVNWAIGDGVTDSATTSVRGTNDFTGGSVDAMVETMVIGRTSSAGDGAVIHKGILTFDKGTIDVNTLRVAVQATTGAASSKSGDGVVNVNGTAELKVNTALEMGVLANPASPGAALTVSTINVNGGKLTAPGISAGLQARTTLVVTNGGKLTLTGDAAVAGTVDAPLDRVNLADASIEVFGGGARIATDALFLGGTANTIKITGLPVINEYPARIPLIRFVALEIESAYNLTLSGLPAANPAYQAALELNELAGMIELVVTAGPVPVVLNWNGGATADWDFTTANFLLGGNAHVFANGDAVLFNDGAGGEATVNLVGTLEPGVITVNNSTRAYTFAGEGSLVGTASLTKSGTGALIVANTGPNTFAGGVNILGGTLQVGAGGTAGTIPASAIVNNGSLVFNRSDNITVNGSISGTGSLTQSGTGTLTLSGANAYTGATTVTSGNLALAGDLSTSGVTFTGGGKLSGSGTIAGPVTITGQVDPGAGATAGTLATGGLNLNSGATLKFDLNSDTTTGGAINDYIAVGGNVAFNNNTVIVNFIGAPTLGVPYVLLTYSGLKTGALNAQVQGTHLTATLDQSAAGAITVTFTGEGAGLKWASTADATWDATALNWLNTGGSLSAFFAGDIALFDDSVPNVVTDINLSTVVVPANVVVNSTANNFTISGAGKISGSGGIEKSGTSTLTVSTANDFTGAVAVNGGTLKAGSSTALGAAAGETTIATGATLDLNGAQLNAERITVSGDGQGGVGAIINTGPQQVNGVGRVVLAGNATFGGTGRWDLRGGGANLSANGMGYGLVKVGPNQVSFVGATIDPTIGDIDIREGVFGIQTTTVQNGGFGDPEKTIAIQGGATLELWNLGANYPLFKRILAKAGSTIWNENGVSAISGEAALEGATTLNVGGTSLDLRGVVSGAGGITKTGAGALLINAENTYTGETRINQGTATISDTGSIGASALIDVNTGATLNVSARSDATLTLRSGQTLSGGGTVNGSIVASAGSTVNPTGRLTVTGDVNLQGATTLDVGGAQNDSISSGGLITAGGALNLNVTGTIPGGTTIQVFQAAGFAGSFSSITPATPGPGQTWVTANLLVDGTISVQGNAVNPQFTATTLSNGNIVVSGNGGIPLAPFEIRGSADLSASVRAWPAAATGNFDANGNFTASIPVAGGFKFLILSSGN